MQALLVFVLFGALLAAVGGLISSSVDSTQQFTLNQIEAVKLYFKGVENILSNKVTAERMEIPYTACPDSNSYGSTNIRSYVCQKDVSVLAEWSGASAGYVDPWKTNFQGFVLRREVPIYATAPNYVVRVPVTAIVLASAGPDRRFNTTVQSSIAGLSTASTLRDVLRISSPDLATCTPATDSCDDIVYTFSNQRAQEGRWKLVKGAVDRIAGGALRNYEIQFHQFIPQMQSVYQSISNTLFDASGHLLITSSTLNAWKSLGVNPPDFRVLGLNSATSRTVAGVDEEFRFITNPVVSGGSDMSLTFVVGNTTHGVNDMLTITLKNSSSPWGQWEGGGTGTLTYVTVVSSTIN